MLRIPRYLEHTYAFLALWFFFGNPINLLTLGSGGGQLVEATGGNFLLPGLSMLFYVVAGSALILLWKSSLLRVISTPQALMLLLFLLVIIASTKWSDYPRYTLRRGVLITGATAFATYFSLRFDFKQQLKLLALALGATALLSLLFGLVIPQYGIMSVPPHVGAWRGVHMHKNDLGPQMALAASFLFTVRSAKLFPPIQAVIINIAMVAAVFLVIVSQSTTAQMALIALMLIFFVCHALKLNYRYLAPVVTSILMISAGITLYLQSNIGRLFAAFGKGSDLSGRDRLWPPILEMVSRKPLFGYGYEGFWRGDGSPGELVWNATGWPTPNAHNGFLEILLAIGWVGGALFLASFLWTLFSSIRLARLSKLTIAICPILAIGFIVLSNITESNLFKSDVWILYIWATLSQRNIFFEEVP